MGFNVQVKPPIYGLQLAFRSGVIDTRSLFDEPVPASEVVVLDPFDATIVAAGISTPDGDELYDGAEQRILSILDRRFAALEAGIFATWNGSVLDLPLLRARARALQLDLGLRIRPDRRGSLRAVDGRVADPTPAPYQVGRAAGGGPRPVSGAWHDQRHLDLRRVGAHYDSPDPCRGAHQARSLADRRWNRARRHLDRFPNPTTPVEGTMALARFAAESVFGPGDSLDGARARHPSNSR